MKKAIKSLSVILAFALALTLFPSRAFAVNTTPIPSWVQGTLLTWVKAVGGGDSDGQYDDTKLTIGADGNDRTITILQEVSGTGLEVDSNSGKVTIKKGGAGSFSGGLTISGGDVTLEMAVDTIALSDGTLTTASEASASGDVTLTKGTLNLGKDLGQPLKVGSDVELNVTTTTSQAITNNGGTVNVEGGGAANGTVTNTNGTFTVSGGTVGGTVQVDGGNLNVESGTVNGKITNGASGTVTVSDGATVGEVDTSGTFTVEKTGTAGAVTVKGTATVNLSGKAGAVTVENGTVDVKGKVDSVSVTNGTVTFSESAHVTGTVTKGIGTVNVTAGQFDGTVAASKIEGGTFTGTVTADEVTGGSFSEKVTSDNVTGGEYTAAALPDSAKNDFETGSKHYVNSSEAIQKAKDGDKNLTVKKSTGDVDLSGITDEVTVKVDDGIAEDVNFTNVPDGTKFAGSYSSGSGKKVSINGNDVTETLKGAGYPGPDGYKAPPSTGGVSPKPAPAPAPRERLGRANPNTGVKL